MAGSTTGPWSGTGSSVGAGDILTALKILNQNMSQLIQTIQGVSVGGSGGSGTFTLGASVTSTIPATAIKAGATVALAPTNAAAATLQGSAAALYVSAITPGTSFAVSTANGTAAHGTETFSYSIVNPT